MSKKKKVKNQVKASEKPTAKLRSINKQEKKKNVGNKKSKNKLVDSIVNQLKSKKKDKDYTVQLEDKQNVDKNNKQNLENKPNSNQNEKKKRRKNKKNKKSLETSEAANSNGISHDKQQKSVQENGQNQETKKKKKRRKKTKNASENNATSEVKQEAQNTNKTDLKNKVLKRLNIDKIKSILKEDEELQKRKSSKKRPPSPLSLRDRMMAQLKASRFRFLNEQMYSNESSQSKKFFQDDPQAFYAYHEGYKHQVERWPLNPVDVIIESIKKMPKNYVIADFGCGEAKLADSVPQTVHSFDLVAVNDKVKACDMANTPLLTGRANVVVFCLSLMGSNLGDYLLEANRVLEKDGILKIAEVESRFDKIEDFIKTMNNYGFVNTWKDLSHNLFYFMDFKKTKDVLKKDVKKLPSVNLKPCLYKKR